MTDNTNSGDSSIDDNERTKDDNVRVVLEQTLLNTEEVFVYKVPPMMTSGGHHAESWNLAKPLATCSLHVLRRDSSLFLRLLSSRPKPDGPPGATEPHLFAQCHVRLDFSSTTNTMAMPIEHWIEPVTDSSRYFVIRISDETASKREAHVGIGFRNRDDATSFKMSVQDYENALKKEQKALSIQQTYRETNANNNSTTDDDTHMEHTSSSLLSASMAAVTTNLSLKDGERIHVNIKGITQSGVTGNTPKRAVVMERNVVGKGGLLLKKPPSTTTCDVDDDDDDVGMEPSSSTRQNRAVVLNTKSVHPNAGEKVPVDACSVAAVAGSDMEDDDGDEWGDFESGA